MLVVMLFQAHTYKWACTKCCWEQMLVHNPYHLLFYKKEAN